jgi:energy-coupling factor transport system permease protein
MLEGLLDVGAVPGSTPVHRLWAGTKLLAVVALAIGLTFARGLWGFGAIATLLLALALAGRVSPPLLWRGVRPLVIVFSITAVILLFAGSGHTLAHVGPLNVTRKGIDLAIRGPGALLLIVLFAQVVNRTTPPAESVAALGVLLQPLRRLRLPVDEFLTMLAISLRFLPIIAEEVTRLRQAQAARGLSLGEGSLDARSAALEGWVTTLITSNLRRAGELGEAMDARGHGDPDAGAFPVQPAHLRLPDWLALLGAFTLVLMMLLVK